MVSVWLLLVAGLVMLIAKQSRLAAADHRRVAVIERRSGPVHVRSERLVRWQESVEKQALFDGDRVATGSNAAAKILFGPGRTMSLSERSQVRITAIVTTEAEPAFMITVFRGRVVAGVDATCSECPPLVLRAGDDTFNVSAGQRVGVVKPLGKKARKFEPKST